MDIIYALEALPHTLHKSLFLAGPSPRQPAHPDWRAEALAHLQGVGFDGQVFLPLPRDGSRRDDYTAQADWEQRAMQHADIIVFWVPRDMQHLPGLSTNVEFGQKVGGRNIVLGYPLEAPGCRFLEYLAQRHHVRVAHTLDATLALALELLGDGAHRQGGECQVPLFLWHTPHFQQWLSAQKQAGNRLDGCRLELCFRVGPSQQYLLYWGAQMNIHVAAEGRNKNNEIVISRPDIKHVVGYRRAEDLLASEVILVREFRATASLGDCFVREVPGGSGFREHSPLTMAAQEFYEETGIRIDPDRLQPLPTRQVAATTTAHQAHVFSVALSAEEVTLAREKQRQNTSHGNPEESELTRVEVYTLGELLAEPYTDWANLGMIMSALL